MASQRQVRFGPTVINREVHLAATSPDASRVSDDNNNNNQENAEGHDPLIWLDAQPNNPGTKPIYGDNFVFRARAVYGNDMIAEQVIYNRKFDALLTPDMSYVKPGWSAACKTTSSLMEGEQPQKRIYSNPSDEVFVVLFLRLQGPGAPSNSTIRIANHLTEDLPLVRKFRFSFMVPAGAIIPDYTFLKTLRIMLGSIQHMKRVVSLQGTSTEREQVFVDHWAAREATYKHFVEIDIEKTFEIAKFQFRRGWINRGAKMEQDPDKEEVLGSQTSSSPPVEVVYPEKKTVDTAWVVNGRKPWPQ